MGRSRFLFLKGERRGLFYYHFTGCLPYSIRRGALECCNPRGKNNSEIRNYRDKTLKPALEELENASEENGGKFDWEIRNGKLFVTRNGSAQPSERL
jgi:hypothetical protein